MLFPQLNFLIRFAVATDVPRCRKGDSECMIKSANKVLQAYGMGIISTKIIRNASQFHDKMR